MSTKPIASLAECSDDTAQFGALLGSALRAAGVPADLGRCQRFVSAIGVVHPASPWALYLCALATLTSRPEHAETLQRVLGAVLGTPPGLVVQGLEVTPLPDGHEVAPDGWDVPGVPVRASAVEQLATRDFASLSAEELRLLAGLMSDVTLAVPLRRSRRVRATPHGRHTDLRATLRQARRTGGHPLRLAREAPVLAPRRLVVLCDISGSMEPYARAMLQLLYCAAGGARAEVFTFATRLTRLTRVMAQAGPDLALHRAGLTSPDWLGGTRIGESLAEFNNAYGRRGMARGAVIVLISDGWDTGDPAVLGREMQRLARVAHRIVWVNPRTQDPDYRPLAAGMAAAWPYCDAVVSGHSLSALEELTSALAHHGHYRPPRRTRAPRAGAL